LLGKVEAALGIVSVFRKQAEIDEPILWSRQELKDRGQIN
jgi:hypothetical protein